MPVPDTQLLRLIKSLHGTKLPTGSLRSELILTNPLHGIKLQTGSLQSQVGCVGVLFVDVLTISINL